MVRIGIIALSALLLYSGVAWALTGCDWHQGHDHAGHGAPHGTRSSSPEESESTHGAQATIKCLDSTYVIGPMLRSSSPNRLRSFKEAVPLKDGVGLLAVPSGQRNHSDVRHRAFRFSSISLPATLSLRLFLSILQA
jgi:hypothetical protein